jgi:hypothetical protein
MAGEDVKFLILDVGLWLRLLTQRSLSPDRSAGQAPHAGRGADAERKGIQRGRGGAILDVEFLMLDCWKVTLLRPADGTSKGWRPTTSRRRDFEGLAPYYAPNSLRGGAPKGWSKVRGCGRPGGVVGCTDVAIRDFVDCDRSGVGLGTKFTDF